VTVHTTYFAALDYEKVTPAEDAVVLGVVRQPHGWVEDLVDRNVPAVAPPDALLDALKRVEAAAEDDDGIEDATATAWTSVGFADQYRDHLREDRLDDVLGTLREHDREGELWLVCYERDPRFCHRRILASELTRGRDVEPVHHPEPGVDDERDERSRTPNARLDAFAEGSP